jgi:iron complex outermembrane recepter protein
LLLKNHRIVFAAFSYCSLSTVVRAEDQEIVVEEKSDAASSGDTVVIDATFGSNADVGDVLLRIPGTSIRRFGGLGDYSSISMRGSSARQVEVFLEEIPLNPDGNSSVNLSELPMAALSGVQVWRSSPPARFYSAAAGGVVNLQVSEKPSHGVSSSAGSHRWRRLSTHTCSGGKEPLSLYLDAFSTDGDYPYFSNQATPFNPSDDSVATRENNGKKQLNAMGIARFSRWKMLQSSHVRDEGLPGTEISNTLQTSLQTQSHLTSLQWNRESWRANVWQQFRRESLSDPAGELGGGRVEEQYDSQSIGGDLGRQGRNSDWFFPYAGTSVRVDSVRQQDLVQDASEQAKTRYVLKPDASAELWLKEGLLASVSLRATAIHSALGTEALASIAPTPRTSLLWSPGGNFKAWASINRNIRPPTTSELFGQRGIMAGNPSLVPEYSLLADAGAVFGLRGRTEVQASYFHSWNKDQIILVQNAQRISVPLNFGRTRIQGVEAMASSLPVDWLSLQLSGSWNHSVNLSAQTALNGKQLPNIPVWRVQSTAAILGEHFQAGHSWFYADQQYWDATNWYLAAPRSIHNAFVRCLPGGAWPAVEVELRNIADRISESSPIDPLQPELGNTEKPISDFSGHPLAGRSLLLSIEWTAGRRNP